MRHGKARHPTAIDQMELALEARGEAFHGQRGDEAGPTARGPERSGTDALMERIVARGNLARAFKRVRQNQGSAGSDGMTVDELAPYLRDHWPVIREELLSGRYQPNVVRQHQIPKAGGGVRTLGIPTVLDRFIQQAMLQVLQPQFDSTFSESSFGFRPGKAMKDRVREITSRSGGRSIPQVIAELGRYLVGWRGYFTLADTPGVFTELEQWLHRRLRAIHLKHWKRGPTVYRELRKRGVSRPVSAMAGRFAGNWWRVAGHAALHLALPTSYFDQLGVPRLVTR